MAVTYANKPKMIVIYLVFISLSDCAVLIILFKPKSSLIADVETSSCESAVDIIAATAPEISNPATHAGSSVSASNGIAISVSLPIKNSSPKYPAAMIPTINAPEIPGIAQSAAIHFAFLISETDLIAMYLISK